jgi:hypothetical protein
MVLTAKQIQILNELINYDPAFRKDQISPKDGGNIFLGNLLHDMQVAGAAQGTAVANIAASAPVAATLNAIFSDVEVEAALLAKADQTAVTALENKLNALLNSLRTSGQIA